MQRSKHVSHAQLDFCISMTHLVIAKKGVIVQERNSVKLLDTKLSEFCQKRWFKKY